jgi:hypothetical protein
MFPLRPRQGVEAARRLIDYCRSQQVQRQPFGGLVARENRSQILTGPSRTTTIKRRPGRTPTF